MPVDWKERLDPTVAAGEKHYQVAFQYFSLACEQVTQPDSPCRESGYAPRLGCDVGLVHGCLKVAEYYRQQPAYTNLYIPKNIAKDDCRRLALEQIIAERAREYYRRAALLPLAKDSDAILKKLQEQEIAIGALDRRIRTCVIKIGSQ